MTDLSTASLASLEEGDSFSNSRLYAVATDNKKRQANAPS